MGKEQHDLRERKEVLRWVLAGIEDKRSGGGPALRGKDKQGNTHGVREGLEPGRGGTGRS